MTRADIEVALPVAAQPSLEALVEMGVWAEELGYERLWLPESWGRDAVTTLATIAERTDDIGISNNVFPVYSRSPALTGQTAATLQDASEGRFRLGLGVSSPFVIEQWHGMEFERPLRRLREYVEIVRAVHNGEPVNYDGELFDLSGFRLRCDPPEPVPPIDLATLGPKALELTGRFADGWQGALFTRDGLSQRLDHLRRGADLGDRSLDDIRVKIGQTACVLDDTDRARELVTQHLAFYIGGMGTFYRDALADEGREELAHKIYDAWQADERGHAMELVAEHLLDQAAAFGTREQAQRALEKRRELDGVNAVSVTFPRGASIEQIKHTIEALGPET